MKQQIKLKFRPQAALIDMDGVLYDSMPMHADAWMTLAAENGFDMKREEFFRMEGMTGAATLRRMFENAGREVPTDDEIKRLYARKSELFRKNGRKIVMPGAKRVVDALRDMGVTTVLVTGSGQQSLLQSIEADYPGVFPENRRVTADDVVHGKPHPEPYLRGLEKAGSDKSRTIVIENAPLGVAAGVAAGCFTIGVTTGPLDEAELYDAGADMVFADMNSLADYLLSL